MAKRRIEKKAEPQKTTLWSFFGSFWKKLSQEQEEQQNIAAIEELTRQQLQNKQTKNQLRLKK